MQPFFRLLDYIFVQILAVLTNPAYFDESIQEKEKKEKKEIIDPFQNKTKEEIYQKIENANFMKLNVVIDSPKIFLTPSNNEKLELTLNKIVVKSENYLCDTRVIEKDEYYFPNFEKQTLEKSYCQAYKIYLK